MNEVDKFVEALTELIENAEDTLINGVRGLQNRVVRRVLARIRNRQSGLIIRRGRVVVTGSDGRENRRRLRQIRRDLDRLINDDKIKEVFERYSNAIIELEALSSAYYSNQFPGFTKAQTKEVAKEAASRTIQNLSNGLQELADPIKQILTIGSPVDFETVVDGLEEGKTTFESRRGKEEVKVRGHLERYINNNILANGSTRQSLVRDSLHGFSRQITSIVTENLGLEWFLYSGGRVRDTRKFCLERTEKYWHKSEVESWASLDWQGKIRGTNRDNIFQNLGGYNCRHTLQPVPIELVPNSAIRRFERNQP